MFLMLSSRVKVMHGGVWRAHGLGACFPSSEFQIIVHGVVGQSAIFI